MCSMDRIENTNCSQLDFFREMQLTVNLSSHPACIRLRDGSFSISIILSLQLFCTILTLTYGLTVWKSPLLYVCQLLTQKFTQAIEKCSLRKICPLMGTDGIL